MLAGLSIWGFPTLASYSWLMNSPDLLSLFYSVFHASYDLFIKHLALPLTFPSSSSFILPSLSKLPTLPSGYSSASCTPLRDFAIYKITNRMKVRVYLELRQQYKRLSGFHYNASFSAKQMGYRRFQKWRLIVVLMGTNRLVPTICKENKRTQWREW